MAAPEEVVVLQQSQVVEQVTGSFGVREAWSGFESIFARILIVLDVEESPEHVGDWSRTARCVRSRLVETIMLGDT